MAQTLSIRLTPKASSDRIGDTRKLPSGEEQLMVYVTVVAEDGKANEAMLRLLAKHLDVAPSRLMIVKGQTNRNKLVRVE